MVEKIKSLEYYVKIAEKVRNELERRKKKKWWLSEIIELASKHGAKDLFEALTVSGFFGFPDHDIYKRIVNIENRLKELEKGGLK